MNQRNLRKWEIRLGIVQIVVLVGTLTGIIVAAYYLGAMAGREMGLQSALVQMINNIPKLPVSNNVPTEESGDQIVSEVYAKLNERDQKRQADAAANLAREGEIPELGSIPTADVAPSVKTIPAAAVTVAHPIQPTATPIKPSTTLGPDSLKIDQPAKNEDNRKVLDEILPEPTFATKGNKGSLAEQTLGSLIEESEKQEKVPAAKPTKAEMPTPLPTATKEPKPTPVATEAPKKPTPIAALGGDGGNKPLPKGWFAQVAAPKKVEDANDLAARLRRSGFAVVIENAEVRGEKYYRILVGPEDSKPQAEILIGQLKRESFVTTEPFLRIVK